MNSHILLDQLTVLLAALFSGRGKFFEQGVNSPGYADHLQHIELALPEEIHTGIFEMTADTVLGKLDPAFYVGKLKGAGYPTIIYHHGNNERPFDFRWFAKNSFRDIFVGARKEPVEANIVALRAPFHQSGLKVYQHKIGELSNFMAMLAVSVALIEQLVRYFDSAGMRPVIVSGLSLGGWVTNLHRTYYNSADRYVPLLAGAALGELFVTSAYQRMTGQAGQEHPEALRQILNFEEEFRHVPDDNVYPLLARYDQYIAYDRQKGCYGDRPIKILEKGHVTASLASVALRRHILEHCQA